MSSEQAGSLAPCSPVVGEQAVHEAATTCSGWTQEPALPALPGFRVIFLGTGCSTALPRITHLVCAEPGQAACPVCVDGWQRPGSKNRRNNVSIAVAFYDGATGKKHCMIVDAGKTFRDAVLRQLPRHGVNTVSSVWLTHGHADAIFGLDDLREFQVSEHVEYIDHATRKTVPAYRLLSEPLTIRLHEETMATIRSTFPYLARAVPFLDEARLITRTYVPVLRWQVIEPRSDHSFHGLPVAAFPVDHGPGYTSLGFAVGAPPGQFVYISDVSAVPDATMAYLQSIRPIGVLVIDTLSWGPHVTHMGVDDALRVVELLSPAATYMVGMSCSLGVHDEFEEKIRKRNPTVSVAFDGLYLDFPWNNCK